MMGELPCAREFDSRKKRKAGPAAAGVNWIIRYIYFIPKRNWLVIAKVTNACVEVPNCSCAEPFFDHASKTAGFQSVSSTPTTDKTASSLRTTAYV